MTNKICVIDNCSTLARSKQLCATHYQAARRAALGAPKQRHYPTPEEAFEARTERQGTCLVWIGTLHEAGYGVMRVEGKSVYAHRWAYQRAYGPLTRWQLVDHRCHNKSCVELTHLREVTQKQNLENLKGVGRNNTSGHRNVFLLKRSGRWKVTVGDNWKQHSGGSYPPYEIHVAAYYAKKLRDKLFTHHDSLDAL